MRFKRHAFGKPLVIAHRGGAQEAPENSWTAVEHTVTQGLTYLETDVHTTADGVPVLLHDPVVRNVQGQTVPLATLTWAEASQIRLDDGRGLILLEEILATYPELWLNLDAKVPESVEPIIAAVKAAGAENRVCVASFSSRDLRRLRQGFGYQVASGMGVSEIFRLFLAYWLHLPPRLFRVPGVAQGVRCIQIPIRMKGIRLVTAKSVLWAHKQGLAVHVWTVNDPMEMRNLARLGVDGIMTDIPAVAKSLFV